MQKNNKKNGYTIIETMIAISLFLVIVTSGMGAFLNANVLYQKSQDMRSIMDNLSFVMEDMSRSLRTGYSYRCVIGPDDLTSANIGIAKSGKNCWGLAFKPQDYNSATNPNEWVYEVVYQTSGSITTSWIRKSIDSGATWVQLTPDEVAINTAASSFSMLGAEPPSTGDHQQPFVTISLVGTITYKGVVTPFSLQTSASQRLIDV